MSAQRRYGLTWEEAVALAQRDAAQLNARMRAEDARTRLSLRDRYLGPVRGWRWRVVEEAADATLASGWAWTERAMHRRRYAAYLRELDRIAEGGAA